MLVDVLALGRVVLYHALLLSKEHVLDGAHLLPGRAGLALCVARGNADVLPSQVAGCDDKETPLADVDFEHTVSSVSVPAIASPLRLPVSVLFERV